MGNRYISLLIVFTLFTLFTLPIIVAQPVFKKDTDITLSLPCTIDGEYCSANATCLATIINPEQEVLINNQNMTQDNAVFKINLTASDTSINGEYTFNVVCSDAGRSSTKNLIFFITPNGEFPSTSKGIMYIGLFALFVIFFGITLYGGKEAKSIVGKSAFFLTSYLILIGISFIAWHLSLDYLTSAPFIASFFRIFWLFLMYALFPVILLLTFYTLWMMKKIDFIENMINKGMPIDEAYERTVKGGFKGSKQW